jgi:hypothetical protein
MVTIFPKVNDSASFASTLCWYAYNVFVADYQAKASLLEIKHHIASAMTSSRHASQNFLTSFSFHSIIHANYNK